MLSAKAALFSRDELRRNILSSQQNLTFLFTSSTEDPTLNQFCCTDPELCKRWSEILNSAEQLKIALNMEGDIPVQGLITDVSPFHQLLGFYYYKLSLPITHTPITDANYKTYYQYLIKAANHHHIPSLLILNRLELSEISKSRWLAKIANHIENFQKINDYDFLKYLSSFTKTHGSAIYLIMADFYYGLASITSSYEYQNFHLADQLINDLLIRCYEYILIAEKLSNIFETSLQNAGGVIGLNTFSCNSFDALKDLLLKNEGRRLLPYLDQARDVANTIANNYLETPRAVTIDSAQ
ncbi:MAG: DUF5630 domain-containing protein [Gammaproteobacteria bacterium]